MKSLFAALTLIVLVTASHSQTGETAGGLSIELERARLQEQRDRAGAAYDKEEAACYRKFAVTDCLAEVRGRRREALADLRRQEISLNSVERKRKGADQLVRIEEKSSLQVLQAEADKRAEALDAHKERQERANQKASERLDATSNQANALRENQQAAEARAQASEARARKAASITEEQKKYNDKLIEARERRASRNKSAAEKPPATAKPLPDPS